MKIKKPLVYLGGPINDCTVDDAADWRESWSHRLLDLGFRSVNPFAVADRLRTLGHDGKDLDAAAEKLLDIKPHQIVEMSFRMIDDCDVVVLNLKDMKARGTISIGSPIELAYATAFRVMAGKPPIPTFVLANDVTSSFFSLATAVVKTEAELFKGLADIALARSAFLTALAPIINPEANA